MAEHYEVKHWSCGVRMMAIFRTQKQADNYAKSLPVNKWIGSPCVSWVTSSQDIFKKYSAIKKAFTSLKEASND